MQSQESAKSTGDNGIVRKGLGRCTRERRNDPHSFRGESSQEATEDHQGSEIEALGRHVSDASTIM